MPGIDKLQQSHNSGQLREWNLVRFLYRRFAHHVIRHADIRDNDNHNNPSHQQQERSAPCSPRSNRVAAQPFGKRGINRDVTCPDPVGHLRCRKPPDKPRFGNFITIKQVHLSRMV